MAITPNYKVELVEEEYIDKGAVTTPQINPEIDARYMKGRAEADAADYVEWPTDVRGQTGQWA